MTTFYVGYRPILRGRNINQEVNTYTGKLGVYSNWDLMDPSNIFRGAPDNNRTPGGGTYQPGVRVYGEGDVTLSQMYTGLFQYMRKSSLLHPGSIYSLNPDLDPYGRFRSDIWRGVYSGQVFQPGFGHTSFNEVTGQGGGPLAAYALWSNYFFVGLPTEQALQTSTLGHIARYPTNAKTQGTLGLDNEPVLQAETFGAFAPYIYKGLISKKSDPLSSAVISLGHPYWVSGYVPADQMPSDYGAIPAPRAVADHYGDNHTREWFGVPSAKAL